MTCQTIFDEIIDYLLETIVTLCNTNNVFMQTFKHIIAVALCAIVGFTAIADKNGGSSSPSLGDIIATPKPNKKRPGAPSRVFITGWYTNSYIELTFPAEVEYMTVSLSAGDIVVWEDVLTVDEPSAHFPEMHGEFTLTVTTDDGRVFECVLDL